MNISFYRLVWFNIMPIEMKRPADLRWVAWLILMSLLLPAVSASGTVLWSDAGVTLAHDTGPGRDILGGTLQRDSSSTGVLYFKFHVDPLSDFHTEHYLAGLQLFEGSKGRLGVGNAWDASSYSAFNAAEAGNRSQIPGEFCLRSTQGETAAPDGHYWELPVRDVERTIVFKVQYVPGTNAVITVWLNPDLGPGATEDGQNTKLTTRFTANAEFNEIHLRHQGGGGGWIFSDMAIATSFEDFVAADRSETGERKFNFQCWHREQELPQESIHALAQSRQGYLWIGTDDGVTRFDGVHFVPYGLREGWPVSSVQTLLEDRAGTLWIGTATDGLARIQDGKSVMLTKGNGLPGDSITALAEDRQGSLWVGTDAGLAICRDGWVSSVPDEFKNKSVTALFEDAHGVLWIGIKGVGIYRHTGDKFAFFGDGPMPRLLKDSHCLLVDRKERLWVGAGDDWLLCLDDGGWIQRRIARHLTRPLVKALVEGADGTIWAGSLGEGLLEFRKSGSQIIDAASGLSDNFVQSLLCDTQGNLWAGTKYGLNELKRGHLFALDYRDGLGYGAVEGLAEVSPGVFWIGKAEDGARRWDGTGISSIPHKLSQGYLQTRAILAARDGSCWIAETQGLWHINSLAFPLLDDAYNLTGVFADGKAIPSPPGIDGSGHSYSANLLGPSINWNDVTFKLGPVGGPNAVTSVRFSLPAGRYSGLKLLATAVNGNQESEVFTVRYADGTTSAFTQSLSDWKEPQNYPGESTVVSMPYRNASDGTPLNHAYYVYGYSFTLNANKTVSSLALPINPNVVVLAAALSPQASSNFVNSESADDSSIQLPKLAINSLCEDSKNNIWAGTQEGALWRWHGGQWTMQTNCPRPVTSLLSGNDGALWIGTEGAGLFRLKNQNCLHYGKANGLLSESIRALHFDDHGTLWIGTTGGGLSRLRDGNIATFTTHEGLPDNTVSQILEDDSGRLWLGSDRGIAAVMRDDLEQCAAGKIASVYPRLYGREDGMPSEECTGGFCPAGLKTSSGLLCFSTQRGLVVVDPHSRNNLASSTPTVIIEQMAVDRVTQHWKPRSGGSPSGRSAEQKAADHSQDPLLLAPGNHQIEIHYTSLNFEDPARVHFRYQLEGLNRGWIDVGAQRTVSYSYLPAGAYRFRVQACGGDGVWSESNDVLAFMVPQFFWRSRWFVGTAVCASLLAAGILARGLEKRRHRQRLAQLEQEHALERERTRIARDLHDEMANKLCRISYLSKDAVRGNGEPEKLRSQITAISENAREVLQALDEIVWAVDPQNDTLENLAGYIEEMAAEYFETTGIECDVDVPVSLPMRAVSSQTRHHLFSAVSEAWTNTLKHSRATRTTIKMSCDAKMFEVVVSDNGVGFDLPRSDGPPNSREFGNGLRNMGQRMREICGQYVIQSKPGHGTLLRFVIPLNGGSSKLRSGS